MGAGHKSKIKYYVYLAMTVLFALGFVASVVTIVVSYRSKSQASDLYRELAETANSPAGPENSDASDAFSDIPSTDVSAPEVDDTYPSVGRNATAGASDDDITAGDGVDVQPETGGNDIPAVGTGKDSDDPADDTFQTVIPADDPDTGDAGSGAQTADEPAIPLIEQLGIEIPSKNIDWFRMRAINTDVYAWIYIPGTNVDYPILQSLTNSEYYLMHNMDGSYGYPACLYTEHFNRRDFTDPNTVVYGHNMTDGTMFASLHYFEDEDFFNDHEYVFVYPYGSDEVLVYRIYAAVQFPSFHLITGYDYTRENKYFEFIDELDDIRSMTNHFREGMEVEFGDKLLTLSTCVKNKTTRRYLVVGVLLNGK